MPFTCLDAETGIREAATAVITDGAERTNSRIARQHSSRKFG